MDINGFREVIKQREETDNEWDYGIEQCWKKEIEILSEDIPSTIEFLKNEMFYNTDWTGVSISEFINILNNYLHWYNEKRIKQSLGYLSPMEYRHRLGLTA